MKRLLCIYISIFAIIIMANGQQAKTDANIVGHMASEGKHIQFANIEQP